MALSVLIVEDEFIIAEDLRAALIASGYKVFGLARTYQQAIELLKRGKPDLALVDITLGADQLGLELGRMFSEDLHIPYIYVSSHSDIGTLEKVKLTNPTGYLLKPFKREAIFTSIEVAMANFNSRAGGYLQDESSLTVKRKGESIRLRYSEILYIESDSNYSHIQTVTNRYTERKTLKELLSEMTDHPFVRVHKSYAVNKHKIHQYTREKIIIGGHEIPIGRTYYDEISMVLKPQTQ